ncbi:hypothetical protein [Kocuria sp. SM24M-10]|uniref:hypothetical protein n=1 Tax=Kocuria sp. SM24M-10 TaxID=1660349 RepID=UPI00064A1B09|nr:hypothetical protein [Kocuria sp. SM24M-10]KLU10921.1 hypothetical protein ABL57_04215 [Kocuria sp. SM24M-10]
MSGPALSALAGAGLIVASHLITLLVARATAGAPGPVAAPALALSYVLKVFVLGWVLLTVPAPPWLSPGWLAAGLLGALAVSLVLAGRTSARRTRAALGSVLRARQEDPRQDPQGNPQQDLHGRREPGVPGDPGADPHGNRHDGSARSAGAPAHDDRRTERHEHG